MHFNFYLSGRLCCILTHIPIQYDYVKQVVFVLRQFDPGQDSTIIEP